MNLSRFFFYSALICVWSWMAQGQVSSGQNYRLVSTCSSGKVVEIENASLSDLARAVIGARDSSKTNQIFKLEAVGGAYKLTAQNSGKVLDIEAASKSNGARVIQYAYEAGNNQLFYLRAGTSGVYRFQNVNSGLYLDLQGQSSATGTPLIQYQSGRGCSQRFQLELVSSSTPAPTPTPSTETWTRCAVEGGVCSFSGTRQVRYGLNSNWATKTATGSINCDNATFGDPAPGADKVCDYSSSITTTPAPAPSPTPAPSTGFQLGQRPFAASSSWNTPLDSGTNYTRLSWPASTGYNYWANWENYSPAVYIGQSTDPLVQVSFQANWGWPAQTLGIRIPLGADGAAGTDGEILIIEGTTVHNCWQFKRTSNTTATCEAYGRTDLITGSGWGSKSPFLSAGIVATGASEMAGLLVQAETDAGEINHALQLVMDYALTKPGSTGEAISGDGSASNGISQEGDRLAIPMSTPMPSGLSPLGQKVFRALQKYGAFNIDVAGGCTSLRVQSNAYNQSIVDALRSDVNRLIPLLQKVN